METLLVSWLPAYLTHTLCSTDVLAVVAAAVLDLGKALEAAAVVLAAWEVILVDKTLVVPAQEPQYGMSIGKSKPLFTRVQPCGATQRPASIEGPLLLVTGTRLSQETVSVYM
jgi:hypothetical protein